MLKKILALAALAVFSPTVGHAQFIAPDCAAWNPTANNTFASGTGYVGCVGAIAGNIMDDSFNGFLSSTSAWHIAPAGATSGPYALDYRNKSDDVGGFGVFTSNPGGTTGRLTFDVAQTGLFALGLKASNQFSVYLFNGGSAGIGFIDFNTIGSSVNGSQAQELSHAAFFDGEDVPRLQCVNELCTTSVVPEPSTYALMATGLLGIFGFARRRRNNA